MSTIKNENNEKYLILRKRYYNECPVEFEADDDLNLLGNPELLQSPGSRSGISFTEHDLGTGGRLFELQRKSPEPSPYKEPPPYKPPPKVMMHAYLNQEKYGECVDEFRSALYAMGCQNQNKYDDNIDCGGVPLAEPVDVVPKLPPKLKASKDDANYMKQQMLETTPVKSTNFPSTSSRPIENIDDKENVSAEPQISKPSNDFNANQTLDKQISVKEATKKFNKIASEEEANKIISPTAKKRPEKVSD